MTPPKKSWGDAFRNGLVSGAVASIASTIVLSLRGKAELGKSAAPVNGPSQWIWGLHAPYRDRFSLRYTIVGYGIHHAASVFWAMWYEKFRQQLPLAKSTATVLAPAIATATAAYGVDFHFTPRRLTPGFERRLSQRSLVMVYGAFALGLAATTLLDLYSPSRHNRPRSVRSPAV
jgi:hypothetical protein